MNKVTPIKPAALAKEGNRAAGTRAFARWTGGSQEMDGQQAIGEIWRANSILAAYIASLDEGDGEARNVLWTVQHILEDAAHIVEDAI